MNYINTHNIILRIFAIKGFSTFFVRIMGRVTWRTGPKLRSMAWNLKLGSNWTGRRGEDTAIRSRWCAHGMWCILHMSGVNLSSWLVQYIIFLYSLSVYHTIFNCLHSLDLDCKDAAVVLGLLSRSEPSQVFLRRKAATKSVLQTKLSASGRVNWNREECLRRIAHWCISSLFSDCFLPVWKSINRQLKLTTWHSRQEIKLFHHYLVWWCGHPLSHSSCNSCHFLRMRLCKTRESSAAAGCIRWSESAKPNRQGEDQVESCCAIQNPFRLARPFLWFTIIQRDSLSHHLGKSQLGCLTLWAGAESTFQVGDRVEAFRHVVAMC